MRKRLLWLLAGGLAMLALGLVLADGADAKRPKTKTLRQEIAALKAEIAQLRNENDYQQRLIVAGSPVPGLPGGLCSDPCATDSDADGRNDCEDPCPCDPSNDDGDGDGVPNCADPCADDATDACIDPCRQDGDGDGTNDCQDPCPFDPSPVGDADTDGIPDCVDPCPGDKTNACGGICVLDSDGDGLDDCGDPCPFGESESHPCVLPPPLPPGDGDGGVGPTTPPA